MSQAEIERAVCRATGESRHLVRSYGFSFVSEKSQLIGDPTLALDCPGCGMPLDASAQSTGLFKFIECPRCDAVFPCAVDEIYVVEGPTTELPVCVNCLSENNIWGECLERETDDDNLDQDEEPSPEVAEALAAAAGISSSAS
jgi:hypothetical protein